jgi:hypothetical protein
MEISLTRRGIQLRKYLRAFEQTLVARQIFEEEKRHCLSRQEIVRKQIVRRLTKKANVSM